VTGALISAGRTMPPICSPGDAPRPLADHPQNRHSAQYMTHQAPLLPRSESAGSRGDRRIGAPGLSLARARELSCGPSWCAVIGAGQMVSFHRMSAPG